MGKKNLSLLLVLALVLGSTVTTTANAKKKPKMKLNKTSLTVRLGQRKTLRVSNPTKKVKWSSSNKYAVRLEKKGKKDSVCTILAPFRKAKTVGKKLTVTAKVGKKKFKCKVTIKPSNNKALVLKDAYEEKVKAGFEKLGKFIDNDPESEKRSSLDEGNILAAAKIVKKNKEYTFSIEHSFVVKKNKEYIFKEYAFSIEPSFTTCNEIRFEISKNKSEWEESEEIYHVTLRFEEFNNNWVNCVIYADSDLSGGRASSYANEISASNNIIFYTGGEDEEKYAKESVIKKANELIDTAYPVWKKLVGKYGMKMNDLGFS